MKVYGPALLFLLISMQLSCATVTPEEPAIATVQSDPLESKADGVWTNEDQVMLSWSEVMQCTIALGTGAWQGAESFGRNLWALPGAIARLALAVGGEILRREADYMRSLTDEEALARVHETYENDLKALRMLLLSIRRAIPELWISLRAGTGWFQTLERPEKIQLVCEVTGRMAFEIVSIMLTDKGITKIAGLARLRLVEGVTGRVFELVRIARLSRIAVQSINDIGTRLSGETQRRWSDPSIILGALPPPDAYEQGSCDQLGRLACPSFVTHLDGRWHVHSNGAAWESLNGAGYLDGLVMESDLLPDGTIIDRVLESDEVEAILSAHQEGLVPEFVLNAMGNGVPFLRVFFPGDTSFVVEGSPIYSELEALIADLEVLLELELRPALWMTGEFWNLTPTERIPYLENLKLEAELASENAPAIETLDAN